MNLRALSNFLSVAEAGSLQGAANIVHIAQPALTRQVAMLEEEFGTRLFLRHHRGVTLTEAGEQLREHAERILAEVAKTRVGDVDGCEEADWHGFARSADGDALRFVQRRHFRLSQGLS
jgi:DNA-binding transcriptional LysR family regulator